MLESLFKKVADLKRQTPTQVFSSLTLSWRRPLSYNNQSIDLLCKSMDWFLYDNGLRHERVNLVLYFLLLYYSIWLPPSYRNQWICNANQLTGFYMKWTFALNISVYKKRKTDYWNAKWLSANLGHYHYSAFVWLIKVWGGDCFSCPRETSLKLFKPMKTWETFFEPLALRNNFYCDNLLMT